MVEVLNKQNRSKTLLLKSNCSNARTGTSLVLGVPKIGIASRIASELPHVAWKLQ